jgi:hypothetical protein
MPRRWKGVLLFAGGCSVALGAVCWGLPLILGVAGAVAAGIGKLWMDEYAFGKSDS